MHVRSILSTALAFAAVATAIPAPVKEDAGERVIHRSAESERKLEAMRRWNNQIRATSKNVASKYVSLECVDQLPLLGV